VTCLFYIRHIYPYDYFKEVFSSEPMPPRPYYPKVQYYRKGKYHPRRPYYLLPRDILTYAPDLHLMEQLWDELKFCKESKREGFHITYRSEPGVGGGERIDIELDMLANITRHRREKCPFIDENLELCSKISTQIKTLVSKIAPVMTHRDGRTQCHVSLFMVEPHSVKQPSHYDAYSQTNYYTVMVPLTFYPNQGTTHFSYLGRYITPLKGHPYFFSGDVRHYGGENTSSNTRVAIAIIFSQGPDTNRPYNSTSWGFDDV